MKEAQKPDGPYTKHGSMPDQTNRPGDDVAENARVPDHEVRQSQKVATTFGVIRRARAFKSSLREDLPVFVEEFHFSLQVAGNMLRDHLKLSDAKNNKRDQQGKERQEQ